MDQDFLPVSIYTIEQKQRLNTISEEITFKSKTTSAGNGLQELVVLSMATYHRSGKLHGGRSDRYDRREHQQYFQENSFRQSPYPWNESGRLNNRIRVSGSFDTPVFSTALYHQSTFNDLFVKGLSVTTGLRLEYEKCLWIISRIVISISISFLKWQCLPLIFHSEIWMPHRYWKEKKKRLCTATSQTSF